MGYEQIGVRKILREAGGKCHNHVKRLAYGIGKVYTKIRKGKTKKMLDVCLLGTSGMLPLPGRWLTSLLLRYNGSSMLIDCGEGTQIAIKEKGWSFHPIDVICFTHYHADHISGLPGLLLTIGNSDRTEPVTLIGPKGLSRVVSALRVIAPELPYELRFIELSESREHISINGYEIDAFKVNHAVTCYGYAVNIPRIGKFDVEKQRHLRFLRKHGTACSTAVQ